MSSEDDGEDYDLSFDRLANDLHLMRVSLADCQRDLKQLRNQAVQTAVNYREQIRELEDKIADLEGASEIVVQLLRDWYSKEEDVEGMIDWCYKFPNKST